MSLPIFVVDAFVTDAPFTGNPAAVCVMPAGESEAAGIEPRLQGIAAEMNLSETAFVSPIEDGEHPSTWSLRWFTPGDEVELCGHATIAAAHALRERGLAPAEAPITFRTRHRGDLVQSRVDGLEEVGLPATPLEEIGNPDPRLFSSLGLEPVRVVRTMENDLVLVLDDSAVIESMRPDMRRLGEVEARGIAVTAMLGDDDEEAAVVSRYFAPGVSVDEDPVTGSLHASLGLLWRDRLGPRFLARQASPRGGVVQVDATRGESGVVSIAGAARLVLVGAFLG
ncbi:MAG: PhzF family phenazine biosynthesis protein [Phycisphaera sp.]|nr:PhzF family phenazine biosynthesis protein [Phycisphaera sp.]